MSYFQTWDIDVFKLIQNRDIDIKSTLESGRWFNFGMLMLIQRQNVIWCYNTNVGPTSMMTLGQGYNVTSDRQIDDVISMMDQPIVAIW